MKPSPQISLQIGWWGSLPIKVTTFHWWRSLLCIGEGHYILQVTSLLFVHEITTINVQNNNSKRIAQHSTHLYVHVLNQVWPTRGKPSTSHIYGTALFSVHYSYYVCTSIVNSWTCLLLCFSKLHFSQLQVGIISGLHGKENTEEESLVRYHMWCRSTSTSLL